MHDGEAVQVSQRGKRAAGRRQAVTNMCLQHCTYWKCQLLVHMTQQLCHLMLWQLLLLVALKVCVALAAASIPTAHTSRIPLVCTAAAAYVSRPLLTKLRRGWPGTAAALPRRWHQTQPGCAAVVRGAASTLAPAAGRAATA